ncbi:hypothetical protein AB6A40_001855 [Gnathostoma spinigerum]|uniref:SOSS complex subunit A homolog n=1 Tax=Gnathostoma spinigerum TaxID=75299 RepID=A0ABD6ECQ5_9BILA
MDLGKLKKQSKLITIDFRFESRLELDEKFEANFNYVQSRVLGLSEKESHDVLLQMTSDPKNLDMVISGLFYGLLTEPNNSHKFFADMALLANDGWFCALCNANMVLMEIYHRLKPECREQMHFFFREAIKSNVPKIDNVFINLIRHLSDGNDFKESSQLLGVVVSLLTDNINWLAGLKPKVSLIPVCLLTFSRIICEMSALPNNDSLRSQLIYLCHWMIHERFMDCVQLGRDLILVLMRLSKISEFTVVWKHLLYSPSKLAPNFGGIEELMNRVCAYSLSCFRISVAMQRKVEFMFNKIKPGTHDRFLEWFKIKHLSGSDSGGLRAELIRFSLFLSWSDIGGPSPSFLAHEMRAVFLSWLLAQANAGPDQQWCKLNLFWDWLCFEPNEISHTLIEPGFNVMRQLLHAQPPLANSLLDFLIRISGELHRPLQSKVTASVTHALQSLIDHNYTSSLTVVFDHQRVEKNIRETFRDTFRILPRPQQLGATSGLNERLEVLSPANLEVDSVSNVSSDLNSVDDELGTLTVSNNDVDENMMVIAEEEEQSSCQEKITALLAAVREEFREAVEALSGAVDSDNDTRCEMMQKLLSVIFDNDDALDEEQVELLAECLLTVFACDLKARDPLPDGFVQNPEKLDEIFSRPIYVIFRNLCLTPDGDATRQPLLSIIAEMCEKCPCISYLLLFFLCSGRGDQSEMTTSAYSDLCRNLDISVDQQLVKDMEKCHVDDFNLFALLIPFVYEKFSSEAMGNAELMKVLCHSLDAHQLADVLGDIVKENIALFRKDSFPSILHASLQWESVAQFIFWQLVHGENVPIDWILPVLHKLQYPKHGEALTGVYLMLLRMDREPNMNLLRNLLSRPTSDMFSVNCLKILIRDPDYASRVAELLASLMEKLISSGDLLPSHAKNKRTAQRYVCLDQLFSHLDKFRQSCLSKDSHMAESFLAQSRLQEAFTAARATEKVSSLRSRYSELFAVMEILNEDNSPNVRSSRRSKLQPRKQNEASDDESKPKKKRQKITVLDSDSD